MGYQKYSTSCWGCGKSVYTAAAIPRCGRCLKDYRNLKALVRWREKKEANGK